MQTTWMKIIPSIICTDIENIRIRNSDQNTP
jgi:hypothetical protein